MKQTARKYLKPLKPIKLGNVSKQLNITSNSGIELPVYASNGIDRNSNKELSIFSHDSKHLKSMKESCKYAAEILNYACDLVKPGITTNFIDVKVFDYCVNVLKVYPSPLNYRTFPKTLCTSVNEVLCHGIPDDRELLDGDIVNLDVSAYKNGHHGDTSRTVSVGEVGKDVQSLCDTTRLALHEAIKICKPGMRLLEIAQICDSIASESGFSVDPVFCGHGMYYSHTLFRYRDNFSYGAFSSSFDGSVESR